MYCIKGRKDRKGDKSAAEDHRRNRYHYAKIVDDNEVVQFPKRYDENTHNM